jgi:hypothetical protein
MRVNPNLYFVGNEFNPIFLKTYLILFCILLKTNFTKKLGTWVLVGLGVGLGSGGLGDPGWACKVACALPGRKFNHISYFVENKFYKKIRNIGSSWTWGGLGFIVVGLGTQGGFVR